MRNNHGNHNTNALLFSCMAAMCLYDSELGLL